MRIVATIFSVSCGLLLSVSCVHAATPPGFVDVSGTSFILDGREFVPHGMNDHDAQTLWDSSRTKPLEGNFSAHPKDFSALGFNSVRLAVKADYFDSSAGFAWLDKRLQEAAKFGLKVVIDMHIPTGGAQQDYQPNTENMKFWTSPELQGRFIETWKKIAQRYAGSKTIWAYDLMNEPVSRDINQVSLLMQHVHDEIRVIDKRHIILLQPVQVYDEDYHESFVYPPLIDDRLAYSIHFYRPYGFTVKGVPWGINDHRVIARYPATSTADGVWDATRIASELYDAGVAAARAKGVPAVIGEFGTIFNSSLDGQYYWIQDVLAAARKNGIGWYYWIYQTPNMQGSYGLTDGGKYRRKEILKLLSSDAKYKPKNLR